MTWMASLAAPSSTMTLPNGYDAGTKLRTTSVRASSGRNRRMGRSSRMPRSPAMLSTARPSARAPCARDRAATRRWRCSGQRAHLGILRARAPACAGRRARGAMSPTWRGPTTWPGAALSTAACTSGSQVSSSTSSRSRRRLMSAASCAERQAVLAAAQHGLARHRRLRKGETLDG